MSSSLAADSISPADFDAVLARYESHVPEKLKELEELRFVIIPDTLKSKREKGSHCWLLKKELQQLMDWKL
jgi:hypothetical protein